MLICPKCKCEYQYGVKTCIDCKCELIELEGVTEKNMLIEKELKINILVTKVIIFSIIFTIGIIILINSLNLGSNEMSSIMRAHGGSMDSNQYIIYLEQSIINYRIVGSLLSLLGGFGVLLTINGKP